MTFLLLATLLAATLPTNEIRRCEYTGVVAGLVNRHIVLRGDEGAKSIYLNQVDPRRVAAGDRIKITCEIQHRAKTGIFARRAISLDTLGHAPAPKPLRLKLGELADIREEYVITQGTFTDVRRDETDGNHVIFTLESDGVRVPVYIQDNGSIDDASLIAYQGMAVEVAGIYQDHGGGRINEERLMLADSTADFRPLGKNEERQSEGNERRSAEGVALASWNGDSTYLRLDDGSTLRVHLKHRAELPRAGSRVRATGVERRNEYFTWLAYADIVPAEGDCAIDDTPAEIDVRKTFFTESGKFLLPQTLDGKLVRIEGTVRENQSGEDGECRTVVELGGLSATVYSQVAAPPKPASRVAITGIAHLSYEIRAVDPQAVRLSGLNIITRSTADIVVTADPPWWNPRRFVVLVSLLFAGLVALFAKLMIDRGHSRIRLAERTAIAVEIHDALSQGLTGVNLQLDSARSARAGGNGTAADRHLATATKMLHGCRVELRRCLWDLRNHVFDFKSFDEAIASSLKPLVHDADLGVRFNVPLSAVSETAAHAVLKIVRELVANAIVHGHAGQLRIAGTLDRGELAFSVADDGNGFDASTAPGERDGHFGLAGIRERVKRLGGTFDIESSSAGTKATVRFNTSRRT